MNNKFVHGLVAFAVIILPMILSVPGDWKQITLGGVLYSLYLFLSQKLAPTKPVNSIQ